jgi:hypothetical protein
MALIATRRPGIGLGMRAGSSPPDSYCGVWGRRARVGDGSTATPDHGYGADAGAWPASSTCGGVAVGWRRGTSRSMRDVSRITRRTS